MISATTLSSSSSEIGIRIFDGKVAWALGEFLVFVFGFVLLLFLPLSSKCMIVLLLEPSPLFQRVPVFVLLRLIGCLLGIIVCLFSDLSLMQAVVWYSCPDNTFGCSVSVLIC